MSKNFPTISDKEKLEKGSILAPRFDANGLLTAIVQDHSSGEILMLAHMNEEALQKTIKTKQSHFWSRSRQELWLKGATSGNILHVEDILIDCDQDAILLKVRLEGTGACHTGALSCFFRKIDDQDDQPSLLMIKD